MASKGSVNFHVKKSGKKPARCRLLSSGGLSVAAATVAYGTCEIVQEHSSVFPAQTGISDGLAVHQAFFKINLLVSLNQIGFDHDADDAAVAIGDLLADVVDDGDLFLEFLM